jgi:hypothetical protein
VLAQYPADLTITDGHKWHILRLRGKLIHLWTDLTTSQALTHIAASLQEVSLPALL